MKATKRHNLIHRAEALAGRGRLRKALALYLQVLKVEAEDAKLLNRAGDLCVRLQKSSDAIAFYKRAAGVLHRQGFFPQAVALCRKILKLDPRLIDVIEALADLLAKQGLTAEAVNQYEALAQYYRNPEQAGAAIRILGRIVELQPASLTHRIELAALLGQEGRAAEAQAQYRSVASTQLAGGQAAAAREALVHAFELEPDDLDLVAGGIDRLRQSGFPEEAEKLFEAALELTPRTEALAQRLVTPPPPLTANSPDAGFVDLAGELEAELGAEDMALEGDETGGWNGSNQNPTGEGSSQPVWSEYLDPEEIEIHYQLGVAYKEMELLEEAVGELQAAAKHPDFLVRCSIHLADCFVEKGFPQLAAHWLERCLEVHSPSSAETDQLRVRLATLEKPAEPESAPRGGRAKEDESETEGKARVTIRHNEQGFDD